MALREACVRKLVRRSRWQFPVFLAVVVAVAALYVERELSPYPSGTGATVPIYVDVPQRVSLAAIARQLHQAGVVRNPRLFTLLGRAMGVDRRLKAGEYAFRPGTPPLDLLTTLEHGMSSLDQVTIPEGLTSREISHMLFVHAGVDTAAFMKLVMDPAFAARLSLKTPTLEGYLFPETYAVLRGTRPEDVLSLMVARGIRTLRDEMGLAQDPPPYTANEILAMASIVEAEAHDPRERAKIAAVYYNRLKSGMRLQADPTVAYAVGKRHERILFKDLTVDHPYNTYVHLGLPPGPICNPGRDAIHAALSPDPGTTALFFVSRGDGTHEFTRTFAQHSAAIGRIRGRGVGPGPAAPAPAPAPGGQP